jgi:hypothetical protein
MVHNLVRLLIIKCLYNKPIKHVQNTLIFEGISCRLELLIFLSHNTTTMPPKNARKCATKAPDSNAPIATISLGEKETPMVPTAPPSSTLAAESYPLEPQLSPATKAVPPSNDTKDAAAPMNSTQPEPQANGEEKGVKEEKLSWTEEMMEMLVDMLYEVFEKGGASDNSFKKTTFELAAGRVAKAYKGSVKVTQQHCKNKWQDIKGKWAYWKLLGEQSGFGWNSETELYEAYDYVWDNLNKSYPGIVWHKTHVMPFRDSISFILHDVQANGKGALTLEEPTPVDPRLATLQINSTLSASPRASSAPPKVGNTPYNKGRKHAMVEVTDDTDEATQPSLKKLDIGVAISGLTKEMERARKAKESYEPNQQRAIRLLEKKYKGRLDVGAFLKAIMLFKDEGNAITFLTLDDGEYRDLWLEMETDSRLK